MWSCELDCDVGRLSVREKRDKGRFEWNERRSRGIL